MSGAPAARRRWRKALLGLALALGAGPRPAPAAEPTPPPWRVLILYDLPPDNPAAIVMTEALRSALREGAAPRLVNVESEMLDALSFDAADLEPEFLALLRKKHYAGRLDLVMSMEAAQGFVRRYRQVLWPGVPIVNFGTSVDVLRNGPTGANSTGVPFDLDEAGTLRLARRLQPDAERLVLVAGSSAYDRGGAARLERAAAREGDGLEVETLFGRSLSLVLDRVSRLPRRSIVLYSTISLDSDGQVFVPTLVAEMISRASTAPVYGIWESHLGRGIVGGSMESLAAHGRRAARVALAVLRGTPADDIPVVPPPRPIAIVDWRQMERFGLSEAALPPGSVVLYRPSSFVKEHRGLVATVGLALALQSALILALLAQARERRKAEAEAARQRTELMHAARLLAVGELTASIAHEINQPLGAILSNAEAAELLLESDPPRPESFRHILDDIRQEAHRASDVIREVRALSRKGSLESMPVDLGEVVTEVLPLLAADARRRGAEVVVDLQARLPDVRGDRTQLRQVVLNLALNALEALEAPGLDGRRVLIRTRAADPHVELVVSDTGPGLAEKDLGRLFESFFTTKAGGLGLGLPIVRSIVEAHGGRVGAENNVGRGATFRLHLPALRAGHPPTTRKGGRIPA
jgi:signal transduction histidine kinase